MKFSSILLPPALYERAKAMGVDMTHYAVSEAIPNDACRFKDPPVPLDPPEDEA